MHLSHLLSDHIQQRQAALVREAEQARLARLARPEKATFQQHWLALQRHLAPRLFWHKAGEKPTARLATAKCCELALPGAPCCVCAL